MAKTKRKKTKRVTELGDTPTVEQMRGGEYERQFVTHAETATKAMAHVNRDTSIAFRWMDTERVMIETGQVMVEDALFPVHAQKFIGDCLLLWAKLGSSSITSQYGERIASGRVCDGMGEKQALDELHRFRGLLGSYQRHYWVVFENVLRQNEPAGVAGSKFANNSAQRQQSAKLITSMVAIQLAEKLGY